MQRSPVFEVDTRQKTELTVFDGSREDESKLAKQFWNSMVLTPPVESTLVCKEINQRTRIRTLNDKTIRPRFTTSNIQTRNEESLKNQTYNERAALEKYEDEAKHIQAVERRNQEVRQLFYKQTKANRNKYKQVAAPQYGNYLIDIHQQGATMNSQKEFDENTHDEDEKQLVCSLPD